MQISFKSKLLLTYSIFIVILLLILGISFYMYNSYLFQKSANNNMVQLAVKISEQLDNTVKDMDKISIEVISDKDIVNSLNDIYISNDQNSLNYSILECTSILQKILLIKTISQVNVYRASIFTSQGIFVSSRDYDERESNMSQKIQNLSWLNEVNKKEGAKYFVLPHEDNWVSKNPEKVFSLARTIRNPGEGVGYIEIQQNTEDLKKACDINNESNMKVLILNDQGQLVFSNSNFSNNLLNYYKTAVADNKNQTLDLKNPSLKSSEILAPYHSNYTGWTTLIIQNKADLLSPLKFTRNITFFIGILILLITLIFFYIFAKYLTDPLRQLKHTMENVNIDNLPTPVSFEHENNEIQALSKSFQRMRERLNLAIEREIHLRSMNLKAQFDALQAQINPHFLFNMLTIIIGLSDAIDNEEISTTCRDLSKMLRYTTSSSNMSVSIKDELAHTSNYLYLMKKRYLHRLEYSIKEDASIMNIIVPKLIIQPLVENSLAHGFANSSSVMKILVETKIINDKWEICIIDNGSGFEPDVLQNLNGKISQYSNELFSNPNSLELGFGGMGLTSCFLRLLLMFGKEVEFDIGNNADTGAYIRIRGPFRSEINKEV